MIPRDYQTKVIDGVSAAWEAGTRRVLAQVPTGGGKTLIGSELINKVDGPVIFMAHRKNLIEQASRHLDAVGIRNGIISPDYPMNGARVRVASVETLVRRLQRVKPPALIVTDECFSGETIVETERGPARIDSINIGRRVLSSDGRFHTVSNVIKRFSSDLVEINGVKCTRNHEFLTDRGRWERAEDLTADRMVLTIINYAELQKRPACKMYGVRGRNRNRNGKPGRFVSALRSGLLFRRLQKLVRVAEFLRENGEDEQKVRFRTNEEKQPYGKGRRPGQGVNKTPSHGSQAQDPGRKRKGTNDSPAGTRVRSWLGNGGRHKNREKTRKRMASMLQGRRRERSSQGRRRSRREFSFIFGPPSSGQKERYSFAWSRVESAPVQKQGNRGEPSGLRRRRVVYDLTVEGSHNYFAGGILVHNCHHAVCGSYRRIYEWAPDALHLGLSATPARLDGQGLDDLFDELVSGPQVAELIGRGYLSPYRAWGPPPPPEVDPEHMTEDEIGALMDRPAITGDAVEHYGRLVPGMPALCFCSTILHAEHVAEAFRVAGWRSKALHSDLDPILIGEYFRRLRAGELDVLTNCGMIDEGTDVPGVAAVLDLAPSSSLSRVLQRWGRSLRPVYGAGLPLFTAEQRREAIARGPKPWAGILDHAGNIERHGLPDDLREWSLQGKVVTPGPTLKRCPSCYEMVPIGSARCECCGWEFSAEESKPRRMPQVGEGLLEEVGDHSLLYDEIKRGGWSVVQARGIAYVMGFPLDLGERIYHEVFGR